MAGASVETGLRIGVAGAAGRMGGELVRAVMAAKGVRLAGALVRKGSAAEGEDAGLVAHGGKAGLATTADLDRFIQAIDVMVDLSVPAAADEHIHAASQRGVALVMAVTGIEADGQRAIERASTKIPLARVPSASLGVAVLELIAERAARALGSDYDIEILNQQHRKKADSPSGGALTLGAAAARGRGVDLATVSIRGRDGETGARPKGGIGFSSVAGGEGIVEHSILFLGNGESIAFNHRSAGREIYTAGLIRAACWLHGRKPGLYGMANVLGLTQPQPTTAPPTRGL